MDERRKDLRMGYPALNELLSAFDQHMNDKTANATDSPVNRIRAEVLRQCREKATLPPGLFSLTVPTGEVKPFPAWHSRSIMLYVITNSV